MKIYKVLVFAAAFVIVSFGLVNFYLFNRGAVEIPENMNRKRIMLIAKVYQNPFWQDIRRGAEQAAINRGCVIEYEGPQTPNIAESLKIFDMGIAIGIDGIITYVPEEKKYAPIIKKAATNGIPVITIEADAAISERIAYVGTDNIQAGYVAGRQLADITGSKANIGVIMSGKTTTSDKNRVEGFKKYISGIRNMRIVTMETSNADIIQAEIVAEKMIEQHPEINALYCTSSLDGIGAARAVVDTKNKGRIKIICYDDLPEIVRFIKEDTIQASIVQKTYQMGYDSVDKMMDRLEGKQIASKYLMGIEVYNKNNTGTSLYLEKGEMN